MMVGRWLSAAFGAAVLAGVLFGVGDRPLTATSSTLLVGGGLLLVLVGGLRPIGRAGIAGLLSGVLVLHALGQWHTGADVALLAALAAFLFWPVRRGRRAASATTLPSPVLYWPWYVRPLFRIDGYLFPVGPTATTLRAAWDGHLQRLRRDDATESLFGRRSDMESMRERGSATFDRALLSDARLTAVGRAFLRANCARFYRRRDALVDYYLQRRAAIAASPHKDVVAPFVIVGLPRTGSTLLQRLLACDPRARAARTFELETPVPPLPADIDPLDDPRLTGSRDTAWLLELLAPGWLAGVRKSHPWVPAEPEEEFMYALGHHGAWPPLAQQVGDDAGYVDWLCDPSDKRPVFKLLHRWLELMNYARPTEQWVLKCPAYSLYPALLLDEFPDARVIVTHRNPFECVASRTRLATALITGLFDDHALDKLQFGRATLAWCRQLAMSLLDYREQHPEQHARFLDLYYTDIEADPIGTVRRIYDYHGLDFTDQHRKNIEELMQRDPRVSHGRAAYSLEEYGISTAKLRQEFRPYLEMYFPQLLHDE